MQYSLGSQLMLQHSTDPAVTLFIPNMCQWSHQIFDFCPFAFERWELARHMELSNLEIGILCDHFVLLVEFIDVCPNAMHDVFWITSQYMEAQHVKHCTQHVHCSAKVHHVQFIYLKILA